MTRMPTAAPAHAPTLRQLNRATLTAASVAAAILVIAVIPAEYGRDPTGVGRLLGLTAMGEAKQFGGDAKASNPVFVPPADPASVPQPGRPEAVEQTKQVRIEIAPGKGREVKALMRKGDSIRYFWQTDGAEIRYELHGERIGAAEGEYSSYQKGSATGEHGNFTAPFDGTHGWYWKNRSDQPIAITVNASGAFESLEAKP